MNSKRDRLIKVAFASVCAVAAGGMQYLGSGQNLLDAAQSLQINELNESTAGLGNYVVKGDKAPYEQKQGEDPTAYVRSKFTYASTGLFYAKTVALYEIPADQAHPTENLLCFNSTMATNILGAKQAQVQSNGCVDAKPSRSDQHGVDEMIELNTGLKMSQIHLK